MTAMYSIALMYLQMVKQLVRHFNLKIGFKTRYGLQAILLLEAISSDLVIDMVC